VVGYLESNSDKIDELAELRKELSGIKESLHPISDRGNQKVIDLQARFESKREDLFETKRERWIVDQFFEGLGEDLSVKMWKNVIVVPTSLSVQEESLELCKKGIDYFNELAGLSFVTYVEPERIRPYLELVDLNKKGNRFDFKSFLPAFRKRCNIDAYIALVDGSDFLVGSTDRVGGRADLSCHNSFVVLSRCLVKGRFSEDGFLDMDEAEKREYMMSLSAHESRHLLGRIPQEEASQVTSPDYFYSSSDHFNPDFGYKIEPHCLGISRFEMPVVLCDRCVEGIRAFWYGVEKRTGEKFIK